MNDSQNDIQPGESLDRSVFQKSLPLRLKVHETIRMQGNTEGEECLDIGSMNSMVSHCLRKNGGVWHTLVTEKEDRRVFEAVLGENVHVMDGTILPFKDKTFDVVVVLDFLERAEEDVSFISECNRILKSTGRLIINVNRLKSCSFVNVIRNMAGLSLEKQSLIRLGYSEPQLFQILKDGFDVSSIRTFSRFFVEIVDAMVRGSEARASLNQDLGAEKIRKIYSIASPFYRLADQLDMFLLFSKGFHLIASAKRRSWRTRNTPILHDGRTISEAVLSKAGD